jgi:protein-S-isoprenylcysteine O-methyltransferase Ste14
MIVCAMLSAFIASLQVITAILFENPLVTVALGLLYLAVFYFALDREEKLLRRITKLEEKLKEYESEDKRD